MYDSQFNAFLLSMQNLLQYPNAGLVTGPLQPEPLSELDPWLLPEPDDTLLEPEPLEELDPEPLEEPFEPLLILKEPLLDEEDPPPLEMTADLPSSGALTDELESKQNSPDQS